MNSSDSKLCTFCGVKKPLAEFSPRKDGVLGRHSQCRVCRRKNRNQATANAQKRYVYATDLERREAVLASGRRYRESHRQALLVKMRRRYRLMKASLLERYGGECECCGERHLEFLAIDHVEGGGTMERRQVGSYGVYRKLMASTARLDGYRVLCHNCNAAIAFHGSCPHQLQDWDSYDS